jgi:hypothetical protein
MILMTERPDAMAHHLGALARGRGALQLKGGVAEIEAFVDKRPNPASYRIGFVTNFIGHDYVRFQSLLVLNQLTRRGYDARLERLQRYAGRLSGLVAKVGAGDSGKQLHSGVVSGPHARIACGDAADGPEGLALGALYGRAVSVLQISQM